ncbi:MAG: glycosyltransferase [Cellvibrionaceae bacterium]|nr:glycosyltransferase [Cellvibrionaceae bacterium]
MSTAIIESVTVVIPVFKGLEITRACLQSVYESFNYSDFRVVIINDCSPEPELVNICREYAQHERIELIENSENLGFVRSVNLGMDYAGKDDVVLLNSDTSVFADWLSRLNGVAYKEDRIATVTPFSNNATICSFPEYSEWAIGYSSSQAEGLDRIFSECNSQDWAEIPTAVGFCMYIKRAAINAVGLFDEEAFGKGYGEECDFCLRLRDKGFINAVAAGVFVHHEGNVSFGDSSTERKKQAESIIAEKYPQYSGEVMEFIRNDHLADFKNKVVDKIAESSLPGSGLALSYKKRAADLAGDLSKARHDANSIASELSKANKEYKAVCQQLNHAQSLLKDAREAFSDVDNSLKEAQQAAENNARDMNVLTQERDILVEQKSEIQSEANRLREQLELIERSRAWRLIQWFKKLLGKQ